MPHQLQDKIPSSWYKQMAPIVDTHKMDLQLIQNSALAVPNMLLWVRKLSDDTVCHNISEGTFPLKMQHQSSEFVTSTGVERLMRKQDARDYFTTVLLNPQNPLIRKYGAIRQHPEFPANPTSSHISSEYVMWRCASSFRARLSCWSPVGAKSI